jgi:predicted kinase
MQNRTAKLILISGKIAAGKSTLARALAKRPGTVLVAEDHWLTHLYPGEIATLDDYVRCSARLREAIGPHIVALLREGLSVVMDFPANTVAQRKWLRGLFEATGVAHELHYLDVSDEVCKSRLRERNLAGDHPFQTSEADFDLFTGYFVAPDPEEGFDITVHRFRSGD